MFPTETAATLFISLKKMRKRERERKELKCEKSKKQSKLFWVKNSAEDSHEMAISSTEYILSCKLDQNELLFIEASFFCIDREMNSLNIIRKHRYQGV